MLKSWYVDRFLTLRETAFRDPQSYFHRYSRLSDEEAVDDRDLDLGRGSISSICTRTSCRPGSAPT